MLEDYHIESFIEYMVTVKGASKNTVLAYRRALADFDRYPPSVAMTRLEHILEFMIDLRDEGKSAATQAQKLTTLRSFFKLMLEKSVIVVDPTSHADMPKVEERLPKALDVYETQKLLNACAGDKPEQIRLRTMLEVLYATGMRVSELSQISLADLDEGQGEFVRVTGKGGKTRLVPLGERAAATLALYLTKSRPKFENIKSNWLFPGSKGQHMTRQRMWQLIRAVGEKAGVQVAPHHLRHTFATHLLESSADIRAIQLMLGHASLTTTQIYTKVVTGEMKKAFEKHPLNQ